MLQRYLINLNPRDNTMTQTPGTPAYMPPEVMGANRKYNTSVDIFSFGVMMIHVFSGKWPAPQIGPNRVILWVARAHFPSRIRK